MNRNNKTVARRGVDFANPKRPSALTLDWTQKADANLIGNTLCYMDPTDASPELNKFPAGATAFYDRVKAAITEFVGIDTNETTKLQSAMDFMRAFVYVTFQGLEEPYNQYLRPRDEFIKMHDVFVRLALRDLTPAQAASLKAGQILMIDTNGKVGFTGLGAAQADDSAKFHFTGSFVAMISGAMLLSFQTDTDGVLVGDIVS